MSESIYYSACAIKWYTGCISSAQSSRENGPCEIDEWGEIYFSHLDINTYNRRCGPAVIYPNGQICYTAPTGYHRIDGPAIIYADGRKEYYVKGKQLSHDEFFLKYGVV